VLRLARLVLPLGPPGLDRRPLPPQLPLPGQGGVLPLDVRDRRQARLQRRRLDGREQLVRDQRIERPAVREPLAERLRLLGRPPGARVPPAPAAAVADPHPPPPPPAPPP